MSTKDVSDTPLRMVFKQSPRRAASDPAAGVRSGKINMLTASPTPSVSLV